MPSIVLSIVSSHPEPPGRRLIVQRKNAHLAIFRRQMRHFRSLIIQAKYGTFAATDRSIRLAR
jgi:hypothetical protein